MRISRRATRDRSLRSSRSIGLGDQLASRRVAEYATEGNKNTPDRPTRKSLRLQLRDHPSIMSSSIVATDRSPILGKRWRSRAVAYPSRVRSRNRLCAREPRMEPKLSF
jgi:hypothetical protein